MRTGLYISRPPRSIARETALIALAAAIVLIEPVVPDNSDAPLSLWKRAAALPDKRVSWDPNGGEAAIFGARTSGIVYLFSGTGKRLFDGGITVSRGHEGISLGEKALASSLASQRPSGERPFVFGCSLPGINL